jgi:hypothetical protein
MFALHLRLGGGALVNEARQGIAGTLEGTLPCLFFAAKSSGLATLKLQAIEGPELCPYNRLDPLSPITQSAGARGLAGHDLSGQAVTLA